jgi:hypothetical protein
LYADPNTAAGYGNTKQKPQRFNTPVAGQRPGGLLKVEDC